MSRHKLKLYSLFVFLFCYCDSFSQVKTEAIDAYFEIVDFLKEGKVISEAGWEKFFKTQGNEFFLKSVRDSAALKREFRSSLIDAYDSTQVQKPGANKDLILQDILYLKENETVVRQYIKDLRSREKISDMYRLAYEYLPVKFHKRIQNLEIYYNAPLVPNAYAKDHSIYINIALDHRFLSAKDGVIGAHELHHILLKPLKPRYLPVKNTFPIILALQTISKEGVADLIDKKYLSLLKDTIYHKLSKEKLLRSDALVSNLNKEIERLKETTDTRPNFKLKVIEGGSGHAPGYYMALIIEKNGFLNDLLENIESPFHFAYVYNKAASVDLDKPSKFSEISIGFLKEIEKGY